MGDIELFDGQVAIHNAHIISDKVYITDENGRNAKVSNDALPLNVYHLIEPILHNELNIPKPQSQSTNDIPQPIHFVQSDIPQPKIISSGNSLPLNKSKYIIALIIIIIIIIIIIVISNVIYIKH